ncbi:MAG: AAA family ATPase [Planctomycetota bacterium]|nr:AAA family ATPase [Planctomycetota bacterium]
MSASKRGGDRSRRVVKRRGSRGTKSGPVPVDKLRWTCEPLKPSGKPPTAAFLIGQERPMAALRAGLSIQAQGYNLFVSGLMGSGRTAVVEMLLRDIQPVCRAVPDRVFVHNFREPNRPSLVTLPAGKGPSFRDELLELGRVMHGALLSALRSRPHRMSRRFVKRASAARERRIMDALQRQAQKQGCALVTFQAQNGTSTADIYPVFEGEPITLDAMSALVLEGKIADEDRTRLLRQREQLIERLDEVSERIREEFSRAEQEVRAMDRGLAWKVLQNHQKDFVRRWPQPEVADWLDAAREFIERNLHEFIGTEVELEDETTAFELMPETAEPRLGEFQSQVVKTSFTEACPVVIETNPSFGNLFGTISGNEGLPGPLQVHPGALLRAEGGYLVLRCFDVLREPGVWTQLKRVLQSGLLEIRDFDQGAGTHTGSLQPQAIPIDLKVVLIGEPGVYEALAAEDIQFPQVFKIHAEFDSTIPVRKLSLRRYADYLQWLVDGEGLLPLSPDAMAAVAEYGARCAGRRDRLITRYSEIGDLAREAAFQAGQARAKMVTRRHVDQALAMQRQRHDLAQELTERGYAAGYMELTTTGSAVGQINALTVLDTGTIEFGRPCRITCNSGVATAQRSGLVNIEGLAQLSGPIHDKGVMILEGFLLQEFGDDGPLCMQATICFEQLYNGVEGDSASLAQLLALLSSLANVPLLQDLAITGSVNQKGEVQAVSGVNDKIEGFFRLCRARKLNHRQGVVLPVANVGDLMLDVDVVQAVETDAFTVQAVNSVQEAIELFTQRPASEVLDLARETLRRFRTLSALR